MTEPAVALEASDDSIGLTDVMLAMDVVDTLRHEELLIERALNEKGRELELVERVRATYAAQGIDVSDEVIAAGVQALKERRFAYTPAEPSLKTRLLTAWTRRRSILRSGSLAAGLLALIGAGWFGLVELPRERQRSAAVAELNASISNADVELRALDERRVRLNGALDAAAAKGPGSDEVTRVYRQLSGKVESSLAAAAQRLEAGSALGQSANYTAENYPRLGSSATRQLAAQAEEFTAARANLDTAEKDIERLQRMRGLPGELRALRDEATTLARDADVDARIEAAYEAAVAAMRQGDVAKTETEADAIKELIADLDIAYTLSIVSRPGELSGVIREPPNNPSASNYYIVVEALDDDGAPVTVAVRGEEDGQIRSVSQWALRVERPVFDRVRADKADDGIIQDRIFGRKERGYLEPSYEKPTTGAAITRWEIP